MAGTEPPSLLKIPRKVRGRDASRPHFAARSEAVQTLSLTRRSLVGEGHRLGLICMFRG